MSDGREHAQNESRRPALGVLVGYDASPAAGNALRWAAREAVRRGRPLTVMHAVDFGGLEVDPTIAHVDDWRSRATDAGRTVADDGARLAADAAQGVRARGTVGTGSAARVLVEQSRHAELVVVGNRGRGELASAWLGSVSMAVATHAHCPTVILRHDTAVPLGPDQPVVVGVDGSAASTAALDVAAALAESGGSALQIVSAWDPLVERDWGPVYASALPGGSYGIDDALHARAAKAAARAAAWVHGAHPWMRVATLTPDGPAAQALVDAADGAGILVVGSLGHSAFSGLVLGSVSHAVVHSARCPVVVVHTPVPVRTPEEAAPVNVMI